MQTSRLKNIIILILVLVNFFLLGTLGLRRAQQYAAERTIVEQLVQLFANDGVVLNESAISFDLPPTPLTLTRDSEAEKNMAAEFLGNALVSSDEGGGIVMYTSSSGKAVFRSSGSFEITGNLGENASMLGQRFCKAYGYDSPPAWFDTNESGVVTTSQIYQTYPVEGCSVTFVAENGVLHSVSGMYLPADGSVSQSNSLLSAASALTTFLEARRTSGAVASAVTAIYPCYQFQSSASSMTLMPTWCVVTDTVNYYVNCSTGVVTHA